MVPAFGETTSLELFPARIHAPWAKALYALPLGLKGCFCLIIHFLGFIRLSIYYYGLSAPVFFISYYRSSETEHNSLLLNFGSGRDRGANGVSGIQIASL